MYTSDDLKAELSDVVFVDEDIAGKIDYARYIVICENYIRANYFGGKNKRMLKLEKPVTSIGFYLVARFVGDHISFNKGERKLMLDQNEIDILQHKPLTYSLFNIIVRNHAYR